MRALVEAFRISLVGVALLGLIGAQSRAEVDPADWIGNFLRRKSASSRR